MDLFFRNIPANTKAEELRGFIVDGVRGWRPWAPALEMSRCDVIRITHEDSGLVEFHGLVTIRDQQMAELVIKKLNGRMLKEVPIEVREYTYRSPGDKRYTEELFGVDRPSDRRRKNLKIERRIDNREVKTDLRDWFHDKPK